MEKFLEQVVRYIYDKEKNNFLNTYLILPNERSCFYIRHYFKEKFKKENVKVSIFPRIIPLKHFLISLTNYEKENEFTLIIILHKIINSLSNNELSITNTYDICKTLLNDFSVFDSELQPEENLNYITNIKNISNRFNNITANNFRRTLENNIIYKNLLNTYKQFKNDTGYKTYEANILRILSDNIEELLKKQNHNNVYYFIGLFFLTEVEKKCLEAFSKLTKSYFIIEDSTFLNSIESIALELKKLKEYFNEKIITFNNQQSINYPKLTTKYCTNKTAQITIIAETISNLIEKGAKPEDIAIILTDENILPLLIKILPENLTFNVTMGYKIKFTKIYKTLFSLFNVFENITNNYITLDLLKTLEYEDLLNFKLPVHLSKCEYILTIDINSINNISSEIYDFLINSNTSAYDRFYNVLNLIEKKLNEIPDSFNKKLEQQAIILIKNITKEIETHISKSLTINDLIFLLKRILPEQKIYLEGNHLEGIQIMGKFESRLLNFKYVIIPDFTEKQWPYTYFNDNTFLLKDLIDVRNTLKEKYYSLDAYLFYRLIDNSQHIISIIPAYDNNQPVFESPFLKHIKDLIAKEFLKHIKDTILKDFSKIYLNKFRETTEQTNTIIHKMYIKNSNLYEKKNLNITNFESFINSNNMEISRYAIENFIMCTLLFFYSSILKLKKNSILPIDYKQSVVGNIVHHLIELWLEKVKYFNFNGISQYIKNNIYTFIKKEFFNEEEIKDYTSIKEFKYIHMLVSSIIENFENNIIDNNILNNYFVENIEETIKIEIETSNNKKYYLKGIVDCILKENNNLAIVDFKNSTKKSIVESVKENHFIEPDKFQSYTYSFQILFYAFLVNKKYGHNVTPYVMFIKENKNIIKTTKAENFDFEKLLISIINQISTINDFQQTQFKNKICNGFSHKCDFAHFCNL